MRNGSTASKDKITCKDYFIFTLNILLYFILL